MILRMIHDLAVATPDLEALELGFRVLSWRQFEDYVISTARQLKETGIRPGQTAVIVAKDCPAMVLCVCALWAVGVRVRLVDPLLDIQQMIKQIEALPGSLVLADKLRRDMLEPQGVRAVSLEASPAYDLGDGFWSAPRPEVPLDPSEASHDPRLQRIYQWITATLPERVKVDKEVC